MNLVNLTLSTKAISSDEQSAQLLYGLIAQRGLVGSKRLQALTGKSQASIARALAKLASLEGQLIQLGKARRTLYAVPKSILGFSGEQALSVTLQDGRVVNWGRLCFLEGKRIYVEATHPAMKGWSCVTEGALPWFLGPLRLQGFLGKLRGTSMGFADSNPEHWSLEQVLFAVLAHEHDNLGAFSLDRLLRNQNGSSQSLAPIGLAARGDYYDSISEDAARMITNGSSAGGEQPKFLAQIQAQTQVQTGETESLIVKFTPPRGTPFGERWHDLLHAEAMALYTLSKHGIAVAQPRIVQTQRRTYLESVRFDRVSIGKRHMVALASVHEAFVGVARQHWAATCETLYKQNRLSAEDLLTAQTVFEFGRLIGNTDMHFGNLSLFVDDLLRIDNPSFTLAPVYDMLPMMYRPSEFLGELGYAPFALPEAATNSAEARAKAIRIALDFWQAMSQHVPASKGFRALATEMQHRLLVL